MYNEDLSDIETEHEDRSPEDSPRAITKKSLSTVGFCIESPISRPMGLRATQSFAWAMEDLRTSLNLDRKTEEVCPKSPSCPCGCFLRQSIMRPFRTREKGTLALHVISPDVLNHHGIHYEQSQIAMFWKKDCRKFLWKGKSRESNNPDTSAR